MVSTHRGRALFTSLLRECTQGKRTSRKQSEVVNRKTQIEAEESQRKSEDTLDS